MKKCKVAFLLNGGLGSIVLALEYVKKFHDVFAKDNNLEISVYGSPSQAVTDCLMQGQDFITHYFKHSGFHEDMKASYDAVIEVIFFPQIMYLSQKMSVSAALKTYFNKTLSFQNSPEMSRLFSLKENVRPNIYEWGMLNDRDRLHIADPMNLLNIGDEYTYTPVLRKDVAETLAHFGLKAKKYITLQRGTNAGFSRESVRDWPLRHYEGLVHLLKQNYPDYTLVQLGESFDNCSEINGVDVCLLGQTDLEDIKVLLKNAWLHIDGECGMVHLRKSLKGGPTVVFMGAAPAAFFGYKRFLNLEKRPCNMYCHGLNQVWFKKCLKYGVPKCMTDLTPDEVMKHLKDYLNNPPQSERPLSKVQEILIHENIRLEPYWRDTWFQNQDIYDWRFEKIKLKELFANILTSVNGKDVFWQKTPLNQTPAYCYLRGDLNAYKDYVAFKNKMYPDGNENSVRRFEALIDSLNAGYNPEFVIVVNGKNIILDGQHRACWLMDTFGGEHEITVLKIYGCFFG